jgi:hypothetical protein
VVLIGSIQTRNGKTHTTQKSVGQNKVVFTTKCFLVLCMFVYESLVHVLRGLLRFTKNFTLTLTFSRHGITQLWHMSFSSPFFAVWHCATQEIRLQLSFSCTQTFSSKFCASLSLTFILVFPLYSSRFCHQTKRSQSNLLFNPVRKIASGRLSVWNLYSWRLN